MEQKTSLDEDEIYREALMYLTKSDEDAVRLLEDILKWDQENPPRNEYHGFEWHQVFGDARNLNNLVTKRILRVTLKTNKSTEYRPTNVKAISRAIFDFKSAEQVEEAAETIPDNLFNIIVGHDGKKELMLRSINSPKPIHFLLWGAIASAKTLMLEELTRLPRSIFILGSSLTKAGIFDILFNERPKYLVIDELDKVDSPENTACLLSLMERGFIAESKYRRHRSLKLTTWVFASANRIERIPEELLSRFGKLHFKEYAPEEFKEVVVDVLREKEEVNDILALHIADRVMAIMGSKDVRDAVKVARLLKKKTKEEADHIVDLMKTQK